MAGDLWSDYTVLPACDAVAEAAVTEMRNVTLDSFGQTAPNGRRERQPRCLGVPIKKDDPQPVRVFRQDSTMFQRFRKLIFVGAIGSSVAVPYIVATGKGLDSVRQFFSGSGQPASPTTTFDDPATLTQGPSSLDPLVQSLINGTSNQIKEIAPPHELTDVFRFDITIDWILQQWPSVSMVSSDLELQGYRVPLVTGINEDDVAGSLTYYFSSDRTLKKITFDGVTGNADRLIREVAGPNRMTRASSDNPGVFLFQRSMFGKAQSELKVRPAEMLSQANANRRFQVSMVLYPQSKGWF